MTCDSSGRRRRSLALTAAAAVGAAGTLYLRWVRPWQLRWGATDAEASMSASGDELVPHPHLVATRAVTVKARPDQVWPWLVQIGIGRAGMYSHDWLDNRGHSSAQELIPALQHMEIGDVVPMREGEPLFGPTVLALDPPHSMLWGDLEEPHTFSWQWLLNTDGAERTRLISRVRYRFRWRDPLMGVLMEVGDPIMMVRCLRGIAERAESAASDDRSTTAPPPMQTAS